MPTPLAILIDPVSVIFLSMYLVMILWESVKPAVKLPEVTGWKFRTFVSFVCYFYLSSYLPIFWDQYLVSYQLIDLSHWHWLLSALSGLLIFEFLLYWWHRAIHSSRILWRVFHQFHHSAERLDTPGAFYFSPFDMIGFTFLGSLALVLIVGVSAKAATAFLLVTGFLGIFQHMNIRTPVWLGYFIQRPESHAVHHSRGVHYYNFSDLPVFDILFGTFRNPAEYVEATGYYQDGSARVIDMLLFRDIITSSDARAGHESASH